MFRAGRWAEVENNIPREIGRFPVDDVIYVDAIAIYNFRSGGKRKKRVSHSLHYHSVSPNAFTL